MRPLGLLPLLLAGLAACGLVGGSEGDKWRPGSRSLQPEHGSGGGQAAAAVAAAAAVLTTRRSLLQSTRKQQLQEGTRHMHSRALLESSDDATVANSSSGSSGGVSGSSGTQRCPQVSKQLLESRARNGTLMFAVANEAQWDFAVNWLHHIKKAGIDYYIVAAADVLTSQRLVEMGQPCFEWIDEEIPKLGLVWGQEGWRRMTWTKVFILDAIVDWGLNLVVSDVDVVWFRDPAPLLDAYPEADLIFSTDDTHAYIEDGDEGLSLDGAHFVDFNTGVYLLRYGNATAAWAHAWRKFFKDCPDHDQMCAYEMTRKGESLQHPKQTRLYSTWNNRLYMGILPPSLALNAHTMFLQKLHERKKVRPYVLHLTWTYNGTPGKRSRLRDLGLWVDPPEYYSSGSFVTVDLQLPEAPSQYSKWNENEDMIAFHLDWIHRQLQQAYVGMALAVAAGRPFILPKFVCYCEKIWYGVVRCRVVSAWEMDLPVRCPQDYLFQPGNYADDPQQFGTPLDLREPSFLDNERTPAEIKESVLVIQPSAALDCRDCVREEAGSNGTTRLLVPPMLPDSQLLPLLEPYRRFRVWRLSFDGVGSTQRAYGGFADAAAAQAFDRRMAHITTDFCCRREEEAPRYHMERQMRLFLNMTSQFSFSSGHAGATSRRVGFA